MKKNNFDQSRDNVHLISNTHNNILLVVYNYLILEQSIDPTIFPKVQGTAQ